MYFYILYLLYSFSSHDKINFHITKQKQKQKQKNKKQNKKKTLQNNEGGKTQTLEFVNLKCVTYVQPIPLSLIRVNDMIL